MGTGEAEQNSGGTPESAGTDHVNVKKIGIASTFDITPVLDVISFWGNRLETPVEVSSDDQNQVFRQLIETDTVLGEMNHLNVVLIRFEDWLQDYDPEENISIEEAVMNNAENLITNVLDKNRSSKVPLLMMVCPGDPKGKISPDSENLLIELLKGELKGSKSVILISKKEIGEKYPSRRIIDRTASTVNRIQYTAAYNIAIGSMIVRQLLAIYRKPYKVVALDCDQTLWKGVCGEDGPLGVQFSKNRLALHEFILKLRDQGMFLALCSKNSQEDVTKVFGQRDEMLLKRSDIASERINWDPKSNNIKSIADELGIGLNRFIFIDDNPVECAEVEANCPDVLTLNLPEDENDIPAFLNHIWAFDQSEIQMDLKEDAEPESTSGNEKAGNNGARSLVDFIIGLDMEISIQKPRIKDMLKISQLTYKTGQFNFTSIKREAFQIQQALNSGSLECRICDVTDRMGEYGLVGVMLFGKSDDTLIVDSFILNWRVLGRGIEHRMLSELGNIAKDKGLDNVQVYLKTTAQNQPARDFIESVAGEYRETDEGGFTYTMPSDFTAKISYHPASDEPEIGDMSSNGGASVKQDSLKHISYQNYVGLNLNSLHKISKEMEIKKVKDELAESEEESEFEELMTDLQESVCQVWGEIMGVGDIGLDDNFFELGGTSLKSYQIISKIQSEFNVEFNSTLMDEFPTIRSFSLTLEEKIKDADGVTVMKKADQPVEESSDEREEIEI